MYHLITFIGRVPNKKENGKSKDGEYESAKYRFPDGSIEETRLFGIVLQEKLKVDRVVILGTSGSMWDALVESFDLQDELSEERMALIENAEKDQVSQKQLDILSPLVEQKLGTRCELRLIPYGENEEEQITILQEISKGIEQDDTVALDVTHGLRHLPMMSLISSFYLTNIFNVKIEGLYYGAFEMRSRNNNIAPVLRLDGLLNIAKWVSALDSFDKDGDYGVFSSLLEKEGMSKEKTELLKRASFYERNFDLSNSNSALNNIDISNELKGIAGSLFSPSLEKRLKKSKGVSLLERQKKLARFYINNGDYVRGIIFLFEAFITSKMPSESTDYNERKKAKEDYENYNEKNGKYTEDYKKYLKLKSMRNSIAHGIEPNSNVKNILKDENKLKKYLINFINEYF